MPSQRNVVLCLWLTTFGWPQSRSRRVVTGFVISPLTRSWNVYNLQASGRDRIRCTTFLSARKHHKRNRPSNLSSGHGFISSSTKAPSVQDSGDVHTLIHNLLLVCGHLQNPDLYSPKWADYVQEQENGESGTVKIVASTDVSQGTILTLYPIHYLSLRMHSEDEVDSTSSDFISKPISTIDCMTVPLLLRREGSQKQSVLCTYEVLLNFNNPTRPPNLWRGHLATRWMSPEEHVSNGGNFLGGKAMPNCIAVPLPGVAPLCGLIAVRNIVQGEELTVEPDWKADVTMMSLLQHRYEQELSELQGYLSMAYPSSLKPVISVNTGLRPGIDQKGTTNDNQHHNDHNDTIFHAPFHAINTDYPGLRTSIATLTFC
jgi:hypothetical protein